MSMLNLLDTKTVTAAWSPRGHRLPIRVKKFGEMQISARKGMPWQAGEILGPEFESQCWQTIFFLLLKKYTKLSSLHLITQAELHL